MIPTPSPVTRAAPPPPRPTQPARRTTAPGDCANPNALGVSREIEIDATGGPRFGFQQYKPNGVNELLREGEIVLTFDDGPAPAYTRPILQALDHHCTKATFFIVGRNALAHPEVVKEEAARGHTIANHTWSHANLGARRIVPKRVPQSSGEAGGEPGLALSGQSAGGQGLFTSSVSQPGYGFESAAPPKPTFAPPMSPDKAEIELGFSATSRALGVPMAPFFRFPYLGHSTAMHNYLQERNVAVFSIDVDSLDYRAKKAEDVINRVLADLKDQKKGILLFHDIQPATAHALPTLLDQLQQRGYRVVHIKPMTGAGLQTIASYDARVGKEGLRHDALAEQKPLVKKTMTWGMASGGMPSAEAAPRPKKPLPRPETQRGETFRGTSPGYVPPGYGQTEILPWLTNSRRSY